MYENLKNSNSQKQEAFRYFKSLRLNESNFRK